MKVTEELKIEISRLLREGKKNTEIAHSIGCSVPVISKIRKAEGLECSMNYAKRNRVIYFLRQSGETEASLAKRYGISVPTINLILKEQGEREFLSREEKKLTELQWAPPIPKQKKILCTGKQYTDVMLEIAGW